MDKEQKNLNLIDEDKLYKLNLYKQKIDFYKNKIDTYKQSAGSRFGTGIKMIVFNSDKFADIDFNLDKLTYELLGTKLKAGYIIDMDSDKLDRFDTGNPVKIGKLLEKLTKYNHRSIYNELKMYKGHKYLDVSRYVIISFGAVYNKTLYLSPIIN